ncbi:MAG: NAAT family transporter [Labilithrix sp.]|nr:NAAT family transporter [Labilithrix sp.]MCW5831443.1 NAAT family transporter [Labilithrix sp.]
MSYALACLGTVFAIVDPIAAVPTFLVLTSARSGADQVRIARRAALTCLTVLSVFAAAGQIILHFFSITLPAFKLAGGIILFSVGVDMVRGSAKRPVSDEPADAHVDLGLVPLGVPLLSGPGAIATVMLLGSNASTWGQRGVVFGSLILVSISVFLILGSAPLFGRMLGRTGLNVIGRTMGLVLTSIAIQFLLDGARDAFPTLTR